MNRQNIIKKLVLFLIKEKEIVSSSYFFHQIFTRLNVFNSVHVIINGLSKEGLIHHEGYFDDSQLFKNITLSIDGNMQIENDNISELCALMEEEFDDFSFIKPIFDG